jgi:hypothetical protein
LAWASPTREGSRRSAGALARTPFYFFIGPRPYREAELAAYIRRHHRRGRRLAEILDDPYLRNRGALLRAVLGNPTLIRALGEDVAEAIRLQEDDLELILPWLSDRRHDHRSAA